MTVGFLETGDAPDRTEPKAAPEGPDETALAGPAVAPSKVVSARRWLPLLAAGVLEGRGGCLYDVLTRSGVGDGEVSRCEGGGDGAADDSSS